jgi:polysaccharide deacetylase 2 family uncharacterized protein YibQ
MEGRKIQLTGKLSFFKNHISLKAFLQGLVAVAVLYAVLFALIAFKGPAALKEIEERMALETVVIERPVTALHGAQKETLDESPGTVEEVRVWPPLDANTPPEELIPAPIEGLLESGLPCIAPSGLTPFAGYKKPFSIPDQPVIAVVIADYGLSDEVSNAILELMPDRVSLVVNPYAAKAGEWQKRARERGHETWMHLPMETEDYPRSDPGPEGLLSSESLQYNQERLGWTLARAQGYAGIAAYSDRAFEDAHSILKKLLEDVFGRGLAWFELNPAASPDIETIATAGSNPYVRNGFFVDSVSLKKLETEAQEKGFAIALVKPVPAQLKSLRIWLDTLSSKGIALAPVSALVGAESKESYRHPMEEAPEEPESPAAAPGHP